MKITILYDNDAVYDGLHTGWGFSCLVNKGDDQLLFDTAWDGDQVIENSKRLNITLEATTKVFISHEHWDHLGGLARLLNVISDAKVFVPNSLSSRLKREISNRVELVAISFARSVGPGMLSTGELDGGAVREHSLIVEVPGGTTLVTGCAHPGLAQILDVASSIGRVEAAIGGFHGFDDLDRLAPLKTVVPCHCTENKNAILDRFPETARRGGVGLTLEFG